MQLIPHSKNAWYTSWPHSHLIWITNKHKQFKRCGSTRELSNIPQHAWLNIQVSWFLGGEHTTSSSCTWWLSGSGAFPGSKRRRPKSIQQGNLLRWQVNKIIYKMSHLTSCAITYGQTVCALSSSRGIAQYCSNSPIYIAHKSTSVLYGKKHVIYLYFENYSTHKHRTSTSM